MSWLSNNKEKQLPEVTWVWRRGFVDVGKFAFTCDTWIQCLLVM